MEIKLTTKVIINTNIFEKTIFFPLLKTLAYELATLLSYFLKEEMHSNEFLTLIQIKVLNQNN
jgi:hypothetical protein